MYSSQESIVSISFRKLGLAAGATLLMSGATASGALAANPITVSLSGSTLIVNDPTGVTQATWIETNGSGFEIIESNSANELVAGTGVTSAVYYDANHQIFVSTNSTPITKITVYGRGGNDAINASTVTNVPVDLFGDTGYDILTGSPQDDVVNGGADVDTVRGGAGADLITGGQGGDTVYGGNGDDRIFDHDAAADTVDGGNDYDEFTRDVGLDTATNIELYK